MTKAKPLDKMTKPELVKALKAAQKRIAKLENQRGPFKASAPYSEPMSLGSHAPASEVLGRLMAASEVLGRLMADPEPTNDYLAGRFPWEKS